MRTRVCLAIIRASTVTRSAWN